MRKQLHISSCQLLHIALMFHWVISLLLDVLLNGFMPKLLHYFIMNSMRLGWLTTLTALLLQLLYSQWAKPSKAQTLLYFYTLPSTELRLSNPLCKRSTQYFCMGVKLKENNQTFPPSCTHTQRKDTRMNAIHTLSVTIYTIIPGIVALLLCFAIEKQLLCRSLNWLHLILPNQ